MLHRIPSLIVAIITSVSVLALAQASGAVAGSAGAGTGTGTGTGSANTGGQLRPAWVQMRAAPTLVHRRLQEWGHETLVPVQT